MRNAIGAGLHSCEALRRYASAAGAGKLTDQITPSVQSHLVNSMFAS
jgi:hypothetical protein